MVGCMVSTSLSMAPASLLAPFARWVDLDGPLLLAADRPNGLAYTDGAIAPSVSKIWGPLLLGPIEIRLRLRRKWRF